MDKKIEDEMADLYISKLFPVKAIAARYGVPYQRVIAVGWRIEQERRHARIDAFRDKYGIEGRVPEHLRGEFHQVFNGV